LEDHAKVVAQIKDLSNSLLEDGNNDADDTQVSKFLQQPSPKIESKTRSFSDMIKSNDEVVVLDDKEEIVSYEVKKEKIVVATKEETVSDEEDV
jgi:hypothetical protein